MCLHDLRLAAAPWKDPTAAACDSDKLTHKTLHSTKSTEALLNIANPPLPTRRDASKNAGLETDGTTLCQDLPTLFDLSPHPGTQTVELNRSSPF